MFQECMSRCSWATGTEALAGAADTQPLPASRRRLLLQHGR